MSAVDPASKAPDIAAKTQRQEILAVLVVRHKSARLERVLSCLSAGTRLPSRLLLAWVGSESSAPEPPVVGAPGAKPIDVSVVAVGEQPNLATAVEHLRAEEEITEPWVWILHDDSAPDERCLERLIHVAERSAKLGAVGPKQVAWDDPSELIEVGIRATRTARRVPELDENERDQGQLDTRSDVLGLGTAGMLVRREAADAVGWFDPALGPFGSGLEFSRRLWAGGWRVAVVPEAVISHKQQSLDYAGDFRRRRSAQMYNAVVAAPRRLAPLVFLAFVVGAPLRALARLVMKDPQRAGQEVTAAASLVAMVGAIRTARARLREVRQVPASTLASLEASGRDVRAARHDRRRARREALRLADRPDPITLAERRAWRAATRRSALAVFLIALALGLVATIDLVGSTLQGGAIAPDSWTARDLVGASGHMWLPTGDGYPAPVDALWIMLTPFVALSASTLGSVASAILLIAIPAAALTGFHGARAMTDSPRVRAIVAIAWAFAPPLLAAVSAGHVAPALWHVLAPLFLRAIVAGWRGSGTAVGVAALLGAYLAACAPASAVVLIGLAAGSFAVCRGKRLRWLWLPAPALIALAPTLRAALNLQGLQRMLSSTPGEPIFASPTALDLLSFSPEAGTGTSALAVRILAFVLVVVAALALALRGRNHRWIAVGVTLMATGWMWAGLVSSVVTDAVMRDAALQPTRGWAGVGLSVAFLGLIVAIAAAGDRLGEDLSSRSFGLGHMLAAVVVAAVTLAPLASAALWAADSRAGSRLIAKGDDRAVPAISIANSQSPDRSRTLVLSIVDGGVEAQLWRANGEQLHESSMVVHGLIHDDADADLTSAIASLAGDSSGFAEAMKRHAVGVVIVYQAPDRERRELVSQLHSAAGLTYVTQTDVGDFWRVESSSRVTLVDQDVSEALASSPLRVDTEIDASGGERVLVLAERADAGWSATVDGVELEPIEDGWQQQWTVPADASGRLIIDFDRQRGLWLAILQAAGAAIAVIAALPAPRVRRKKA